MVIPGMPLPGIAEPFRLHDAMNEECRLRHFPDRWHQLDDFFHFAMVIFAACHDGIEIPGGQPVGLKFPQLSACCALMKA